ncbi:YfiR family protein [Carboxylicivirga sp. M1479]|uniref:YfiR family protein n=1 Tax=Carboxylicivirga sp. M1479 TaxID=2594476 RepID=UPI0011782CA8|nr:YfiR family protein [Carboxylicivirga sp. M1479]TRX71622.1 YfiR family protein [Carboxylicivirga sp. M1479]
MKKVLFFMALMLLPLAAQSQVAKFKSVFTLSFIRHIGWTESAKKGDFVIGVVRDREIADWMTKLSAGKKFGFQNVVIKEFKSPEEVVDCQVVYVSSNVNFSKHASTIVNKVNGGSTLIITESEGACGSGSMINFVVRDDKLKFEIHKSNAAKFGLQVSSKLEGMSNAISL